MNHISLGQHILHRRQMISAAFFRGAPSPVPVPAAIWLFGAGILSLVGVARGKKAKALNQC